MDTAAATLDADLVDHRADGRRRGGAERATVRARVLDATVRCVARWGVAKTTLDDVARQAGCSRATVYRVVPGGKAALLEAAAEAELATLLERIAEAFDRSATLEDLLAGGLSTAAEALRSHEALTYLLRHEPATVLSGVAFDALDPLLETAAGFAAPWLEVYLPPEQAAEVAEWLTRLVVLYSLDLDGSGPDLADPAEAARFVRTYVMPGLEASRSPKRTTDPTITTAPQE
ncbi:MAG: TetR/AcrR family transcriptional regulator [Acidimicrobiia bacterium]|nr:TetR/AcrR family transcriptional regulator [Acidimicrobiia bacterium]